MNRLKDNASVDPSNLYSGSYLIDPESGYNNNHNLSFVNEFKIETSLSGSHSAPTSLMTGVEHFSYPHYTPNMEYSHCAQSTDDSFGSSGSSGTKLSYTLNQEPTLHGSSYLQSSGLSIDSYFSNSNIRMKSNEVDENENSLKDDQRRNRGRGRAACNGGTRKRHMNQENDQDCKSTNGNQTTNGSNGKGKHGKACARHPFIPSYMDPNNGPHLCVVCRHNASGFHYRVMACEGCKGFFRRTVQNNLVYTCKFNNKCDIQPHNRAQCQECRWRKCLDVGMAKDLVLSEEARRAKKELIAANRAKKMSSDKSSNIGSNEFPDSTSPNSVERSAYKISEDDERIINQIRNGFDETDADRTELSADFEESNAIQILQCVVDHHVTSMIIKCDIVDDINIQSAKYNFSQQFMALTIIVKPIIQRIISFAFMIPKFTDLAGNDQIVLLKNACFDIISLRNAVNFDKQSQTLMLESDFPVTKEASRQHKLLEPTYVFVNRISSLNMDYFEISLMAALTLLCCDRMGLQDLGKVESLQDDILRAIDCYMKLNYLDNTHRQSELYATVLPELRSTTSWHTQIMLNSTDSFIGKYLSTLKAIYHYPDEQLHPQSSKPPRFMIASPSPMAAVPSSPNQCHQIYSPDLKYLSFPYLSHTIPSLYSGFDSGRHTTPITNRYSNSHLVSHSGPPRLQPHTNHLLSSNISSFTELLIDPVASTSDMKVNHYPTQESPSSSTHANYTPVTNHSKATNNDPVFDFSNDLI